MRLRGVRADRGFCLPELLDLREQLNVPYVVVAQLAAPIKNLLRGGLVWTPTELRGTDVAERDYQTGGWEKILSPFPNCNAVENRPAFTH